MASPFPGMDPYLEAQRLWEDFHTTFIPTAREILSHRLPSHYEARIEERLSLMIAPEFEARKAMRPDVAVLRRGRRTSTPADPPGGGIATLEPVTVPLGIDPWEVVREHRIEIRRRPRRTLVTVIELLSPSNKVEPGRGMFLEKRLSLIHQPVHLVELDLLIEGERLPTGAPLPSGDYYALVSRSDRRFDCDVYTWPIRQPLPTIPVPLEAPDPDVPLDLAAVFATVFERGGYGQAIDYRAPLELSLKPDDRAWAEALARTSVR